MARWAITRAATAPAIDGAPSVVTQGSMRKTLPVLASLMTVAAIAMSSGAAYAAQARAAHALQNQSAEILQLHASVQAEMSAVTNAPSVPAYFLAPSFKTAR